MICCRSITAVGFLLLCVGLLPLHGLAQSGPADPDVLDACDSIAELLAAEAGLQNLVNPVLRNQSQIDDRVDQYREMLSCLDSVAVSTRSLDWARNLRYHLRLFLSFAAPSEVNTRGSSLELVDLQVSDDPAVRRLIEELGLAPPEGSILVRYFQSREQMPENIQRAFESPQTQAVTMSSRYVAVLTSPSSTFRQGGIGNSALAATFSHELVHAFLNARLDTELSPEGYPRWFHEGMAIHYSDRGRAHISVDPVSGRLLRTEPTAQYEQYERVFRYLESELGADRFSRQVRRSVEDVDPSILYGAMDFRSYEDLALNAELWWRWWPLPLVFVRGGNAWLFGGLMIVLGAGAALAWRRWQPAISGSALEVGVDSDLIEAVKTGDITSMVYMIRSGANPDSRDDGGWGPLAWAVWADNAQAVELLVNGGAAVTSEIRALATSRNCSPGVLRLLVDALTREDDDSVEMDRGY